MPIDETELPFWEQPDTVARFSGRDPDHRLQAMVGDDPDPRSTRVLDLGCAGGRNTVYLAGLGFDVVALDGSSAMVAETRRRLAAILTKEEARDRVHRGRMDDLGAFADESIDLVVALGIYHGAGSRSEWDAALSETRRVLTPGGRVLISNHTDAFRSAAGEALTRLSDDEPIYERRSGPSFLVDAATLDAEMAEHGFDRLVSTETVSRETEGGGVRVTANGLYGKPA